MPPSDLTPAERDAKCLAMVARGDGYEKVAKAVGYKSKGSVSKAIKRALAAAPAQDLSRDELLQIELHKISLQEAVLWPKANRGSMTALSLLNTLGRRRDRIMGLNVQPRAPIDALQPPQPGRSADGVVVPMRRIDKLRAQYDAEVNGGS